MWRNPPLACVCHATVTVTAADGSTQVLSARVVIVPVHLIVAVLAAAVLLFLGLRLIRRRYRAHVIEAAHSLRGPPDA